MSRTKAQLKDCPMCKGEGQVQDGADDMFGNSISFMSECDWCEGTGSIDSELGGIC